jgi:hypothetical protein
MQNICLKIMPPSMTESLGVFESPTSLYEYIIQGRIQDFKLGGRT